jgi:hypothetical protein
MRLVVRDLFGAEVHVRAKASDTVTDLKREIAQQLRSAVVAHQRLIFDEAELEDSETLGAGCGLFDGATVHLVLNTAESGRSVAETVGANACVADEGDALPSGSGLREGASAAGSGSDAERTARSGRSGASPSFILRDEELAEYASLLTDGGSPKRREARGASNPAAAAGAAASAGGAGAPPPAAPAAPSSEGAGHASGGGAQGLEARIQRMEREHARRLREQQREIDALKARLRATRDVPDGRVAQSAAEGGGGRGEPAVEEGRAPANEESDTVPGRSDVDAADANAADANAADAVDAVDAADAADVADAAGACELRPPAAADAWSCHACTFVHARPEQRGFLACAVCGAERVRPAADGPGPAQPSGAGPVADGDGDGSAGPGRPSAGAETDGHVDFCSICGDGGLLTLCDRCPRSFHARCLRTCGFPLATPPPRYWHCPKCAESLERAFDAARGAKRTRGDDREGGDDGGGADGGVGLRGPVKWFEDLAQTEDGGGGGKRRRRRRKR